MKRSSKERQNEVQQALSRLMELCPDKQPVVGIVLGSGLGMVADQIADPTVIPYDKIPGFPRSAVKGHAGRLVVGELQGVTVAAMQGRVHLYEGYSPDQAVLPVRALRQWGIRHFVITNAAGSIDANTLPGSLVLIKDHINMQGSNCLVGPNVESWGPRFPDMGKIYTPALRAEILEWADANDFVLREGIYGAMLGPGYETPAEIQMLRKAGVSVVGMSTVQEAMALRHMDTRIIGVSCVTNLASGIGVSPLSHDEVAKTAFEVAEKFARLIGEIITVFKKRLG